MTNKNELRSNDLCNCKVGRNTVLVTLISKDDSLKGGWLVRSTKTGKEMIIRDASRLSLAATPEHDHTEEVIEVSQDEATPKPSPKTSLLDAAVQVLEVNRRPMNCHEIVEVVIEQNFWTPGSGRTPSNSLYSSIIREIAKRGDASRFRRSDERGKFELVE